jgi:hypothetical protein
VVEPAQRNLALGMWAEAAVEVAGLFCKTSFMTPMIYRLVWPWPSVPVVPVVPLKGQAMLMETPEARVALQHLPGVGLWPARRMGVVVVLVVYEHLASEVLAGPVVTQAEVGLLVGLPILLAPMQRMVVEVVEVVPMGHL